MPRLPLPSTPKELGLHTLLEWGQGWWQVIRFGAWVLVLALSPSSYRRTQRLRMVRAMYRATMPMLPAFVVLSATAALIIIRIVLATAASYGLSRYALDVLVRTLVLELIPLSAAMFAALRYGLPAGEQVRLMRMRGDFKAQFAAGRDPMRDTVLPRAVAGLFAVITLAALSSAVTLVLTYLSLYGFTAWGLAGFARSVGQVFNPVIVLIFGMKTFFLSMAVAIIPMVPTRLDGEASSGWFNADIVRLARLLAVVLLIEMLSLVGNYY